MNEIDLLDFLKNYENTEILFVPNPGNSGDFLITYVTMTLFEKCFDSTIMTNNVKKYILFE